MFLNRYLAKDNMELSEMIFDRLGDSERTYSTVYTTCLRMQMIDVISCYDMPYYDML